MSNDRRVFKIEGDIITYIMDKSWSFIKNKLELTCLIDYKLVSLDDTSYAIFDDYRPYRLNIEVNNDIVTNITLG